MITTPPDRTLDIPTARAFDQLVTQIQATVSGSFITVTPLVSMFTAPVGSWIVRPARAALSYTRIGSLMFFSFLIAESEVTALPSALYLQLPNGLTAVSAKSASFALVTAGIVVPGGVARIQAGQSYLSLQLDMNVGGSTPWATDTPGAGATYVEGQIVLEVKP